MMTEREFDKESLWTVAFQNALLHSVEVDASCADSLIRALHPHDGVIPAPNLIKISLCQMEFDPIYCQCGEYHGGVREIHYLLHALAKRAEAGNMLPGLDLVACADITEDDVKELSKVVGQIEYPETKLEVEFETMHRSADCLLLPIILCRPCNTVTYV